MEQPAINLLFTGVVIPERALVSTSEFGFLSVLDTPDFPKGNLSIQIIHSQISARYVGSGVIKNIYTLRNHVEDCARVILDVAGFHTGAGFDVDITMCVDAHGPSKEVFGRAIPTLSKLAEEAGLTVDDIFSVLFSHERGHFLRQALADLREATKSPIDTGFFCYRALEALRNASACQTSPGDKEAWETFRNAYSIEESKIRAVKSFADKVRHGHGITDGSMTDSARGEILVTTWKIVCSVLKAEVQKLKAAAPQA